MAGDMQESGPHTFNRQIAKFNTAAKLTQMTYFVCFPFPGPTAFPMSISAHPAMPSGKHQ